jgi:hypothetical protein
MMLAEIRELIRRKNLRAVKALDTLEQALSSSDAVRLRPVKQALEKLDFVGALEVLDEAAIGPVSTPSMAGSTVQ